MKKLLRNLSIATFTFSIVSPTVSCFLFRGDSKYNTKFSDTKTLLYDVPKNAKKIHDDRLGHGSLIDLLYDSAFKAYKTEILENHGIAPQDLNRDVVYNYIKAVDENNKYLADFKVRDTFAKLANTKIHFKTINDVVTTMKSEMPNNKFNFDFDKMAKCAISVTSKDAEKEFKTQLLETFNRLANVYGLDWFKRGLYQLLYDHDPCNCPYCQKMFSLNQTNDQQKLRIVAYVALKPVDSYLVQGMYLGPDAANQLVIAEHYWSGWWSTKKLTSVITHEFGHVLDNYLWVAPNYRYRLNNNELFQYDDQFPSIKDLDIESGSGKSDIPVYNRKPSEFLEDYIADKLEIPKSNNLQRRIAAWTVVQSNYGRYGVKGRGTNVELFAEAFAAWLLTPPKLQTLSWQVLNEFFTKVLPAVYEV